jgi:hypothetical protein
VRTFAFGAVWPLVGGFHATRSTPVQAGVRAALCQPLPVQRACCRGEGPEPWAGALLGSAENRHWPLTRVPLLCMQVSSSEDVETIVLSRYCGAPLCLFVCVLEGGGRGNGVRVEPSRFRFCCRGYGMRVSCSMPVTALFPFTAGSVEVCWPTSAGGEARRAIWG